MSRALDEQHAADQATIARYARMLQDGPVEIVDLWSGARLKDASRLAREIMYMGARVVAHTPEDSNV